MDIPMIISVCVLLVIAVIEAVCLIRCPARERDYPVTAAFPIFPDSDYTQKLLSHISVMLTDGSNCIDRVILVDCGADGDSLDLCADFRNENPCVVIAPPELLPVFFRHCCNSVKSEKK